MSVDQLHGSQFINFSGSIIEDIGNPMLIAIDKEDMQSAGRGTVPDESC